MVLSETAFINTSIIETYLHILKVDKAEQRYRLPSSSHKVKPFTATRITVRNKEALMYLMEMSYLCSSFVLWAVLYRLEIPILCPRYRYGLTKCRIYSINAFGVGNISERPPMTHIETTPLRTNANNAPQGRATPSTNPVLQKIVIPTTANIVIICGCQRLCFGNSGDKNEGLHSVELLSRKAQYGSSQD